MAITDRRSFIKTMLLAGAELVVGGVVLSQSGAQGDKEEKGVES
jgi:hypothetical protein